MRRFPAVVLWLLTTVALAVLAGCGGPTKISSSVGVPAQIRVTPASVSLNLGPPGLGNTVNLSATVLDVDGNAAVSTLVPTITYKSSNPSVAGVSPSGLICGGAWDANFVVCNPGAVGTAQITAIGGGLTSNAVAVFVHQRVDTITVTPTSVNCVSQGQAQQMTARAFSNGVDVTSTVGPFNWTAQTPDVVTANVTINGLLTAKTPGLTPISATLTGSGVISSVPATFVTCPVKSISVHVKDKPDTSVTLAPGGSQQIAADAVDILGNPVAGLTLTVLSRAPAVGTASFPPANTTNVGLATAVAAGTTTLLPVCASPTCNINLPVQYGNLFSLTVSGPSVPLVFAADSNATSLVAINTANTPLTAGAPIALPSKPNSMRFDASGNRLFMGSDTNGAMLFDTVANSTATASGLTGKVLAVSPDGTRLVISDVAADKVFVEDTTSSFLPLNIVGATSAAYSPDGSRLFIVAGDSLYVFTPGTTLKTIRLGRTTTDVAMLASGAFTYLAGPGAIAARATCDASAAGSVVAPNPSLITPLPNGTAMIAADSPNLDVVHVNSTGAGCPPAGSPTLTTVSAGEAFTARQIIPLADSSKVYITTNVGLLVYDVAANTTSKITLAGGALPFTGGASLDNTAVYVGASDNAVHIIKVATNTDDAQVAVPFTPDLVAVSPR